MKLIKTLLHTALLIAATNMAAFSQTYNWSSVRIGGGGLVSSINAHPLVPNLRFMTTDVGNPYRWNNSEQAWEPLLNNMPAVYWSAVCGNLAFDPQDATGNILYITVRKGAGSASTILKSTDRGNSWSDLALPIWLDPNSVNEKFYGERLAVDPLNSSIVYVTTRAPLSGSETTNGTYRSTNAGTNWTKVDTLHGRFIVFDTTAGTISGACKNVYIGNVNGVYKSTDGGVTFSLMPGSPAGLSKGVLRGGGILYATKSSGIYKWDGVSWTTITTPFASSANSGIDVNPNNSSQVIAATSNFNPDIFLSTNAGGTWTKLSTTRDKTEVPFSTGGPRAGNNIYDFAWDPFNASEVWFSDLLNVYQTTNVFATPSSVWKVRAKGHEEVVVTGPLLSPSAGNNLLMSVTADVAGFDHVSLTNPPVKEIAPEFQYYNSTGVHMTGAAFQETNPNFIARVGRRGWSGGGLGGYSLDGGLHYTQWVNPPNTTGGRIAVSATNETMIWTSQGGYTYRSTDRGQTWTKINSVAFCVMGQYSNTGSIFTVPPDMNPLAADKVNGNKFYIYLSGTMWVSIDGGITFAPKYSGLPNYTSPVGNTANAKVETTPDKEGDIWVSVEGVGLYHSTNSGDNFTKISNVQNARLMAVGMAAINIPAVYVFGTVNNIANGLFRSDDNGATWTTISSPAINFMRNLAADRRVYGRVFAGLDGNGIYTGQPVPGAVTGVTIDSTAVSIPVSIQSKLTAFVKPAWAGNKTVTWTSLDTSKVSVNTSTGVITAKSIGTASVIVTTQEGGYKDTVVVTVTAFIPTTGISITPDTATVGTGSTLALTAVIVPANATDKSMIWRSADTTIAKVSATGVVTGVNTGTVMISAYQTTTDSKTTVGKSFITVSYIPATAVAIGTGTASVGVEDVIQLQPVFTPANATNKSISWTSSDTTIAKVSANGTVTGRAVGSVTITATGVDAGVTATRTVSVISKGLCGLLPNNGFESSLVNWFIVGAEVNGNKAASIVTTNVHSGLKAVMISGEGGVSTSSIMLVPGTREVTFKAWAKVEDMPLYAGFGIDYIDSFNNKITADQFQVTETFYKEFSVTRVTPANTARVNIWTYKSGSGGRMYMDDFCVTSLPVTYVTSVNVTPDSANVGVGYIKALTATVLPSTASIKTVTWASSVPSVATVNASGVVTGIALGTARIIATTTDGGKMDSTYITVVPPVAVTSVVLSPDTAYVGVADKFTFTANVLPSNASNTTVTWASTNTAIATVNASTGQVTAVAMGTASIIATTQSGSKKDTSIVIVISQGQCGLLTNNGFESSLVNWNNTNNGATITTDVHSGLKAVKVVGDGGVGYGKTIPFTVGDTMVFTAWAKVSGGPAWAGFSADFQNASGTKLATAQFTVTSGSYAQYSDTVVIPAGTSNINIWAYKSGATGALFLDDFCLSKLSTGSLRMANGPAPASVAATGPVAVKVYPNPVQQDINLSVTNYKGQQLEVILTDMSGRIVHREKITTVPGRESYRLNTGKITGKGQYILNINGTDIKKTIKLLIP